MNASGNTVKKGVMQNMQFDKKIFVGFKEKKRTFIDNAKNIELVKKYGMNRKEADRDSPIRSY